MPKLIILFLLLVLPCQGFSQNTDIKLLRFINSPDKLASDKYFRFASGSEAYIVAGIPVCMASTGLLKHDDELIRNACVVLVASGLNSVVTIALKYSINRDRPFVTYPDIIKKSSDAGSPSFPSGHTSMAFTTATTFSLQYPKWYVIAPAYTWAGTVAYSRMHLGVHYPSDVVAGAIIGSLSGYITYKVNKMIVNAGRGRIVN